MALVVKDRVRETTTTTGTGTVTLAGAVTGFQSFSVIGNANTTYYTITNNTDWEVGIGTYTASGTTLSRDTILESSNSGAAVNFAAGTKDVFVTYPAEKSVNYDASDNVGIGTTSPGSKLDVAGTIRSTGTSVGKATLEPGAATNSGYAGFYNSAGTRVGYVGFANDASGIFLINSEVATNALTFSTASTERMRIDSSGNVGIGASSPSFKLDIQGSPAQTARVYCTDSASGSYAAFNAANANGVSSVMYSYSGAGWYGTTSNHPTIFLSNNTERMRIGSSGNVLINETTPSAAALNHNFEVNGDIMTTGSAAGLFWANRSTAPSSGADWYGWYTTGGTIYLYNPAAGNIASINASTGAYTALSDVAKKKDFEPSTVGLDAVLALKPTLFRMETDDSDAPKQLGFIAQEVKDHIPQAYVEEQNTDAVGNENTYIGLNDRPIIAALVKAVQELEARVAQLEERT